MASDTPEALLDAAEALFSERGYDAVGIRELADRAGANVAAIRYHFGGKRELYLETVRRAMRNRTTIAAWETLEELPTGRREAAVRLCRFVRGFLDGLLGDAETAVCARLFLHESRAPSEAVDDVIRDFVAPNLAALGATISRVDPRLEPDAVEHHAQFVLGLLLHHHTCRLYVERCTDLRLDRAASRARLAEEIARFSLRGLRAGEGFIEGVIAEARSFPLEKSNESPTRGRRAAAEKGNPA